jgi:hypothetical protein
MANAVRKEHHLPLTYIALDWHELDKQLGSGELVGAFWSTLTDILPAHKFALGTLTQVGCFLRLQQAFIIIIIIIIFTLPAHAGLWAACLHFSNSTWTHTSNNYARWACKSSSTTHMHHNMQALRAIARVSCVYAAHVCIEYECMIDVSTVGGRSPHLPTAHVSLPGWS